MKLSKNIAILAASAVLAAGSAIGVAPTVQATTVHSIFNPDACIVKLGWNMNLSKAGPDGIRYYMYGDYTGPNSCPSGSWKRLPGYM